MQQLEDSPLREVWTDGAYQRLSAFYHNAQREVEGWLQALEAKKDRYDPGVYPYMAESAWRRGVTMPGDIEILLDAVIQGRVFSRGYLIWMHRKTDDKHEHPIEVFTRVRDTLKWEPFKPRRASAAPLSQITDGLPSLAPHREMNSNWRERSPSAPAASIAPLVASKPQFERQYSQPDPKRTEEILAKTSWR